MLGAASGMMEFAMGKPADDSGTRPRVNSHGSRHPFISRWRCSKAGRTNRQQPSTPRSTAAVKWKEWKWLALAARAWSWFPCWGSWRCSCAAPLMVSELGCLAPGSGSRCLPRWGVHAHGWQQDEGEVEGNYFSTVCCLILLFWSWIVRGLNREYPRQHGSEVQMGFIYLVIFLHSSTKQPGLLPVLHQSPFASVGAEGLY